MKNNNAHPYRLTTLSCFVGIFVQAIACNQLAVLFLPLMRLYGLRYAHLGFLVGVNFVAQVFSDLIFSRLIDRIGFKRLVLPANIGSLLGLLLLALAPVLFDNILYGLLLATIVFAISSGLLEVLLSPIISAIPADNKGPAMSLMHSFYAWGQVVTIVGTTLLLFLWGEDKWQWIVLLWCVIPLVNFVMFLCSKFPPMVGEGQGVGFRSLKRRPFFWLALLAILFGGATEVTMNQWASTFMESGLALPKLAGDLIGMCGFSVLLGLSRAIYGLWGEKLKLGRILLWGSLLGAVCYLTVALSPVTAVSVAGCVLCGLASGLLWPGTIVLAADRYPMAGGWMFALLAAAGDIGASSGPWLTGLVIDGTQSSRILSFLGKMLPNSGDQNAMRLGLCIAAVFPVLSFICHFILNKLTKNPEPPLNKRVQENQS